MSIPQAWIIAASLAVAQSAAVITGNGDAWILARVAEGETGFLFPGTQAERWVMWTVRNRVESDRFPDDYQEVIENGYHGHESVGQPDKGLLVLAQEVIDAAPGEDPTGGCLFVYSADDVLAWQLSTDTAVRELRQGRWGLFFYREEPEREEQ